MKTYDLKVSRTVSYTEDLEVRVSAKNKTAALEAAAAFAGGGDPIWPTIDNYVVKKRTPIEFEVASVG